MSIFNLFRRQKVNESTASTTHLKSETHRVVGMQYYTQSIMKLAVPNPNYNLTKKEIISKKLTGQTILEYNFNISNISLVEEPTNPEDPNAVQVIADGVLIGYIKKGSCSHVKKLLHSGNITSIELIKFILGKSKIVEECYEEGHFEVRKDSSNGYVEIKITYKEL